MVEYIFQTLAKKGSAPSFNNMSQKQARDWYRNTAQSVRNVNANRFMADPKNLRNRIDRSSIGQMYMFFYDPKTKKQLPYWDNFPLVIPIELYNDGFLGLNMHYLSPLLRAKLMDSLYDNLNNDKFDETTRLDINYKMLAAASRYKYFKPCIKRYLSTHMRSRALYIEPMQWDMALMLPTERFEGASKSQVFKDSSRSF